MSSALKTQIQTVSNYSGTLMTFYEAPLCEQSYLSMFLITPDKRAQNSREGRNRNLCSFKQETGKAAYTVRKCDGQGGGAHVVLCWSRDLGLGWEPANCAAPNRPLPLRIQAPIKDCAASFRLSTLSLGQRD